MRRLISQDGPREPWVVFADIVLAALFLFVLFIFAQYVRYEKLAQQEELERRRREIAALVRDSLPLEFQGDVAVGSGEAFAQRITFSSDLLFDVCRETLTDRGRNLVAAVGELLGRRLTYFEAIEIEGHTDQRLPTGDGVCPFVDNWDLSSRRAATVVRILTTDATLDPRRLSAVGKAQFHGTSDGCAGLSGSQLNECTSEDRRIEILLQYSESDIDDALEDGGDRTDVRQATSS